MDVANFKTVCELCDTVQKPMWLSVTEAGLKAVPRVQNGGFFTRIIHFLGYGNTGYYSIIRRINRLAQDLIHNKEKQIKEQIEEHMKMQDLFEPQAECLVKMYDELYQIEEQRSKALSQIELKFHQRTNSVALQILSSLWAGFLGIPGAIVNSFIPTSDFSEDILFKDIHCQRKITLWTGKEVSQQVHPSGSVYSLRLNNHQLDSSLHLRVYKDEQQKGMVILNNGKAVKTFFSEETSGKILNWAISCLQKKNEAIAEADNKNFMSRELQLNLETLPVPQSSLTTLQKVAAFRKFKEYTGSGTLEEALSLFSKGPG